MMDFVYLCTKYGTPLNHAGWIELTRSLEWLLEPWDQPDEGIWEKRGGRRERRDDTPDHDHVDGDKLLGEHEHRDEPEQHDHVASEVREGLREALAGKYPQPDSNRRSPA